MQPRRRRPMGYRATLDGSRALVPNQHVPNLTPPQEKHLLHRVVKEVRVHDRETVEAFYAVPNADAVRIPPRMARLLPQYANRTQMPPRLRSWPISVRRRRRRGTAARGLGVVASPSVGEILLLAPAARPGHRRRSGREALVWRALLAAGALDSRAALARWRGVSRARVTQVLRLGEETSVPLTLVIGGSARDQR